MSQKQRILELALKLMAERGSEGMSMRDLAAAAEVNVATIYHYFPSKRDLLTAILEERGYLDSMAGPPPVSGAHGPEAALAALLDETWQSMLEVEDYIRLMVGEAVHGDEAAQSLGEDLLAATQASFERWLEQALPTMLPDGDTTQLARLLRAVIIGVFIEHLAGSSPDPSATLRQRASEIATLLLAIGRPHG